MLKKLMLVLVSISIIIFSIGCEGSITKIEELPETEELPEAISTEEDLWINTREEVIVVIEEVEITGEITSTVSRFEWPRENDQANFEIEGSKYAYYEDSIILKIEDKWILFSRFEDWAEDNNIKMSGGFMSVGYDKSDEEEIFGGLNQEAIDEILEKISDEVSEDENYETNKDSIIEKVFKENGITHPDKINAAKSKMIISK